jgi:hypothetical protein
MKTYMPLKYQVSEFIWWRNWRNRGIVLWSLHLMRKGRVHSSLVLWVCSVSNRRLFRCVATIYDLRFTRRWLWRTVSSGMLRRVALVRNDVSEELTRATRRNIPEDTILHSHRRETLKSYSMPLCIILDHNSLRNECWEKCANNVYSVPSRQS